MPHTTPPSLRLRRPFVTFLGILALGLCSAGAAAGPAARPTLAPVALAMLVPDPAPARILRPPARILPRPPELALVLDDMGHDPESVRRVAALPVPLTAAFLPYVPDAPGRVAIAREAGKEIFLHMPMEPESEAVDPGPMVLRVGLDDDAIRRLLDRALASVPGSVGINNHMGSRFTREPDGMRSVVSWAAAHGLVFLDSRTTAASVGAEIAARSGVAWAERHVFLDNEDDPAAIRAQLERAVERARRHGHAVAIGHPRPATLDVLERWIPEALSRGVRFVTAGQLALRRACRRGPMSISADRVFSGCRSRSSRLLRRRG